MDTDKAYLFGVLLGGGKIVDDKLSVKFPYKKWGEALENPDVAGKIAEDLLERLRPVFRESYGMEITYETDPWRIRPIEITEELEEDLEKYGFPSSGEFRKNADIAEVFSWNETFRRQFVAGMADAIGSVTKSHRRFDENYQIVSFEISGNNFKLVHQIYRLMESVGIVVDQVLWNHPNMHSGNDPLYQNWKKGFKIRIILNHFLSKASFVFSAKMRQAEENLSLQSEDVEVSSEDIEINPKRKCVHEAENDEFLPENIRGYHFGHWRHLLAFLEGEDPTGKLKPLLEKIEELVSPFPFPVLKKGEKAEIRDMIQKFHVLRNRNYREIDLDLSELLRKHSNDANTLVYGNSNSGYPVKNVLAALNFVLAAQQDELFGTRARGNREERLREAAETGNYRDIRVLRPELLAPLLIEGDEYSAMVGPHNPNVYQNLVTKEGEFAYKIRPITEGDLRE